MPRGVITRVRWNADERKLLLQRSQLLMAEQPGEPIRNVVTQAVQKFDLERRRKVDAKTITWVREEIKKLPPLRRVSAPLPTPAPGAPLAPAAGAEPSPAGPNARSANADPDVNGVALASSAPAALPSPAFPGGQVVAALSGAISQIIVNVLTNPEVRKAARDFVSDARPRSAAEVTAAAIWAPTPPARTLIAVVGVTAKDAATLEKEFAGMLPLRTWSPGQGPDQLELLIEEARLVVGVEDGLPQTIVSALVRLGDRYVRHRGGMAALHKRLAEEALR